MLQTEKKESKSLNTFQKLLDQPEPSVQSEQAGLEQQRKCSEETTKNQLASEIYPEILVPYLNNPSEETIFGSIKIKEQHETMKLPNESYLKP